MPAQFQGDSAALKGQPSGMTCGGLLANKGRKLVQTLLSTLTVPYHSPRRGNRPMDDEKLLRNVDAALGHWLDRELQGPPRFGGKPGDPVPAVDPEDVKTVWHIGRDAQANHAGKHVAVG